MKILLTNKAFKKKSLEKKVVEPEKHQDKMWCKVNALERALNVNHSTLQNMRADLENAWLLCVSRYFQTKRFGSEKTIDFQDIQSSPLSMCSTKLSILVCLNSWFTGNLFCFKIDKWPCFKYEMDMKPYFRS